MKIADLLYFDRKNETEAVKKSRSRRRMFTASILCGVIGTLLLITGDLPPGFLGSALIILFLYGFFISFSSGVPAFFDKRPVKKYTKTNLLVFRSLSSKLNTMGVTMATIAPRFTATLISEAESGFEDYKEYIDQHIDIHESCEYSIYLGKNDQFTEYIESCGVDYCRYYDRDTVLRMSDYTVLRKMPGYSETSLKPDGYIIHCMDHLKNVMEEYNSPLTTGSSELILRGIYTEDFTQFLRDGNGRGFILVVPDEAAEAHGPVRRIYAAMANEPVWGERFEALSNIRDMRSEANSSCDTILSPAAVREDNAAMYAMIVFPLFYLALVLTMVAATILTIQLLSDVNRYRMQYGLLDDPVWTDVTWAGRCAVSLRCFTQCPRCLRC